MNHYNTDINDDEVLYSSANQQVMMEWEKPYMEDSIDFLEPTGDVLEIGFGLGYSATQIMKHKPKSYTVIECDKKVIEKANEWVSEWDKKLPEVPVTIVEGTWQDMLQTVGKFDSIYFDDFPLGVWKADKMLSRVDNFISLCIQYHTKIGSKISVYLNHNCKPIFSQNIAPFVEVKYKSIVVQIPTICEYRNLKEQKCLIPLITKVAEYDEKIAQEYPNTEIDRVLNTMSVYSEKCSEATKALMIPIILLIFLTGKAQKADLHKTEHICSTLKSITDIERYFIY